MTEPAGDEEIAGTLNRDRLLILFSFLIWISSGFLFSAIILFFTERIAILDVVIIMSIGLVLSYFLIHGDAVIVDQLISYFRKKFEQRTCRIIDAALPTIYWSAFFLALL